MNSNLSNLTKFVTTQLETVLRNIHMRADAKEAMLKTKTFIQFRLIRNKKYGTPLLSKRLLIELPASHSLPSTKWMEQESYLYLLYLEHVSYSSLQLHIIQNAILRWWQNNLIPFSLKLTNVTSISVYVGLMSNTEQFLSFTTQEI